MAGASLTRIRAGRALVRATGRAPRPRLAAPCGRHIIVNGNFATFTGRARSHLTSGKDETMTNRALKLGAALAILLASGAAYADDPTGVLEQMQRADRPYAGHSPGATTFSDVGPCGPGSQSEPFPNAQGFRCVPNRE
jgi:hypothetical protein